MSLVLSQQLDHHPHQNSAGMHSMPLSMSTLEAIKEFEDDCYSYCVDSDDEGSLFSIDFNCIDHDTIKPADVIMIQEEKVYHVVVDVMNSESSMDALLWTLGQQAITRSSSNIKTVFHVKLVHVFPTIGFIPSPLGMLPRSKVIPRMVKKYLAQERDKKTKLLEKYVAACSTAKVNVEVMLIESDSVAKAILDLIPTQNVTNLVVGATKSSLRKLGSRRGTGVANQILRNLSPEMSCCDIKIICKGKEVFVDQLIGSPRLSSRSSNAYSLSTQEDQADQQAGEYVENLQHRS